MRLEVQVVLKQIADLKVVYPDIWDDGDEKLLADCLESETEMNEFLTVLVDQMQDAKAYAGGIATRIAELELRQQRYERREQAMRDLAFKIIVASGQRRSELPEATLSIRNVPPKVLITNEENLPDIACKFTRTPDKTKIKELLQTGPVAGACMSNGSETLAVKTR